MPLDASLTPRALIQTSLPLLVQHPDLRPRLQTTARHETSQCGGYALVVFRGNMLEWIDPRQLVRIIEAQDIGGGLVGQGYPEMLELDDNNAIENGVKKRLVCLQTEPLHHFMPPDNSMVLDHVFSYGKQSSGADRRRPELSRQDDRRVKENTDATGETPNMTKT